MGGERNPRIIPPNPPLSKGGANRNLFMIDLGLLYFLFRALDGEFGDIKLGPLPFKIKLKSQRGSCGANGSEESPGFPKTRLAG
jgi:hypothetical protein